MEMERLIEDALERTVRVPSRPLRIVSLVPSVTELLFDLGAGERVVGVSRYCSEPATGLERLKRVGGQKDPDLAEVRALSPDLVIAVREENLKRDIERLEADGVSVYVADVRTVEDAVALIGEIGDLIDATPSAIASLRGEIAAGVAEARRAAPSPPVSVFVPVWRDPWIAPSSDTYLYEALRAAGGAPILAGTPARRYPKVTLDQVREAAPQAILLPDEPYAFGAADAAEMERIAPTALVDGKALTWYGRRTAHLAAVAQTLAHLAGR